MYINYVNKYLTMENYPRVSIIILNYNGVEDSLACLKSLEECDYPNFEISLDCFPMFKANMQFEILHIKCPKSIKIRDSMRRENRHSNSNTSPKEKCNVRSKF